MTPRSQGHQGIHSDQHATGRDSVEELGRRKLAAGTRAQVGHRRGLLLASKSPSGWNSFGLGTAGPEPCSVVDEM